MRDRVADVVVAAGPERGLGRRTSKRTSSSVVKMVPSRASSSTSEAEGAGRVHTRVRISAGKGVGQLSRKYIVRGKAVPDLDREPNRSGSS